MSRMVSKYASMHLDWVPLIESLYHELSVCPLSVFSITDTAQG